MYFGAASRRACGRAVAAGARAYAPAFGHICHRVQSPFRMHRCVYHVHAWRLPVASARSPSRPPIVARRARPHARAVRGRSIDSTKVQALPESLGRCKLLERLCVPRPSPPPCTFTAVPAPQCCAWRCRAERRTARRRMRRRRRCRSSAAAEPRARMAGARSRPARGRDGPEPPGAAARSARREAHNTELAALPAAAEWPSLKTL
jgi:hypothetical protein